MPIVPLDSPLRKVPESVERRDILFLDGVRYSFQIIDLAQERLAENLKALGAEDLTQEQIAARFPFAIADAWTLVDSLNRLRELILQMPNLKQSLPEVQLFLRQTKNVEEFRNFHQHFRSEIDNFSRVGMPLWGTLSWWIQMEGGIKSFILSPGTTFSGMKGFTPIFDQANRRFKQRVRFQAGAFVVDLADLYEQVERFSVWYAGWYREKFSDGPHHGSDTLLPIEFRFPPGG